MSTHDFKDILDQQHIPLDGVKTPDGNNPQPAPPKNVLVINCFGEPEKASTFDAMKRFLAARGISNPTIVSMDDIQQKYYNDPKQSITPSGAGGLNVNR